LGFCFAGVSPLHPTKKLFGKSFLDFQKLGSAENAKYLLRKSSAFSAGGLLGFFSWVLRFQNG